MSSPPVQLLEIYNSIPVLSQPLDFAGTVCLRAGKYRDRHLNLEAPPLT